MSNRAKHSGLQHQRNFIAVIVICFALFATSLSTHAQTPEEHASHHGGSPVAAKPAGGMPTTALAPAGGMPAPGGGMMEQMGEMMKGMGKPPPKDLYPSLMSLPEMTAEKRDEIVKQAAERMNGGIRLVADGVDRLNKGVSADDFVVMRDATSKMREGLALFESGVAAHQAIVEGKAPRDVALQWFRSEMSLPQPGAGDRDSGLSWFHLSIMAMLIVFAVVMIWMYFCKMRRAAALFGRLDPGSGSPPPETSPPGGRKPDPPASGDSPAGKTPSPPAPTPQAAETPAATTSNSPTSPATTPTVSDVSSTPPLNANWKGQLRVGSIVTETPNVKTFRLLPSTNERFLPFTFIPGQFLNLTFGIGGARMNRSYSISSSPTQREYIDLTVRREPRGAVSRHIVDLLKVGDPIDAGGPVGRFTFTGTEADSIVLISAGVGITPMMSIARYLTERSWPGDIYFVYTCHAPSDFIFADEVSSLQRRNPKLHVAVTISKTEGTNWKGDKGRIMKEWLNQSVPDLASRRIHLCGPPTQMDSIRAILGELKVPPENLKTEAFGTPKPAPAAPGTTAKPTVPAIGPLVTFSKNGKSAKIHADQTILELSEELGIAIEFSCRVGTCGICKVKMTSGEVDQAVQDALDADDKTNGIILACQAKPKSAVMVEA